ncbi:alpha/beta hydrolase family protein [Actinophytocola xanthii]|uniref:Alpha/beta hydrolase n=1 Tax=Actinophytocola xanthii TaxID=1912961 RepID=A0A1Q8BU84_9PSEU|nr:hypothetical protein [Actinophytocola xanthii]OLF05667.1 hypothetical protein BU204_36955 [Actinophytocola xanthii]
MTQDDGITTHELTFPGEHGHPVVATLVRPAVPAVGGVVIAHGGTDDGRRFFVEEARELAAAGLAVLLPAIRLPRHGDIEASGTAVNRALTGCRRGLDLLTEQTGVERLCYFGHSGGAALGAQLGAVEPRLEGLVLAGIGAGTVVRHARADLLRDGHPDPEPYLEFLDRLDPRHHVSRYTGRLFIQYGRRDDAVTMAEALALRAVAGPTTEWAVYDDGHGLAVPPARRDRARFLLPPRHAEVSPSG